MITPVQQTPIPLDPVRQQITPTPPVEPPAPPRPAETPVQAMETTQDKFNPRSGDGRDRRDQAFEDQQRAETAGKLRSAYLRLNELKKEAGVAAANGDAPRAKALAAEAAAVADTIPASVGIIELATHETAGRASSAEPKDDTGMDVPAALDIARAGLGSAKDVVDTAAGVPHHPVEDRIAIGGMRRQVLDAMAGVEAIANRNAETQAAPAAATSSSHIDLRA